MKKHGILNSHIAKLLADFGHTDLIAIADAGLPVPDGVVKIDLSLQAGVPAFRDVAGLLAEEMAVEKVIAASEIKDANHKNASFLESRFSEQPIEYIPHEEFKRLTQKAKAVIRTGEMTPYANCILQAGVIF
ncbi:ribose ABC transporter [Bacillus nakamurai]|uniref:D-ribose pyranase n=1 Tax=Bacillus nakamurai TaxID=1793963 RepID=A0A150F635_9BACI|nr:D-ribose pyranase [Bacillus nakamurai]KXZ17147.1 ribose ABC transporter [Bacillus nakamurai]KXZ20576.1 ribose ABC transporter [Bacillus nakamurai]MCC9024227.1 D-ribose pyranase [Bacillus nakamurai]MCP6684068.1 D-ribose pyranase [Bacillus nakamurai]MED1228903.1 D-ribose pyranase [Bacillus nakamurai]